MKRWAGLAIAFVLAAVPSGSAEAADDVADPGPIELQIVTLPAEPVEVRFGDAPLELRNLRIRVGDDRWFRLRECDADLCAVEISRGPPPERLPADAVPGTPLVTSSTPFVDVWLADAAARDGTGVLPGPLAGAVVGRDRKGRAHRFDLPLDQGIDALAPWLADLDGDGTDEIVTTTVRAGGGSVLTVLSYRDSGFAIAWESDAAAAGVWRDIVGIADLDGDGVPEIATVTAGDGLGRLELWQRNGDAYVQAVALKDFASLVPGTRTAGIAAVADMDGDGIEDLVLPSLDRMSLRVISFAAGQVAEPYRIALPGEVVTQIAAYAMKDRKRPVIVAGVSSGRIVLAR